MEKPDYKEKVLALIKELKLSNKSASEIMGFSRVTFYLKMNGTKYNRFTKENYDSLLEWANREIKG